MVVMDKVRAARRRMVHLAWLVRYWVLWKYRRPLCLFSLAAIPCILTVATVHIYTHWGSVGQVLSGSGVTLPLLVGIMGWDDVIYYVVALVISAAISAATAPTPEAPPAGTVDMPTVKDGAGVARIYGEVWIDDPVILGWMNQGVMPIKKKAGKK